MPYTITRYQLTVDPDGKFPFTLNDNTIDNTHTTLNLIGRGVNNYGQFIADDLVWVLENFAGPNTPANPITGQEWYDTTSQTMKFFNGTSWSNVGPFQDSNNIVVSQVINGNPVLAIVVNGETLAIWSTTTFTPSPPITGFSPIRAGLNLNESLSPLPIFYGENINPNSIPLVVNLVAASYSFVPNDNTKFYIRANAGTAMSDTLPSPINANIGNGWKVTIINDDLSASDVITATSGLIDGAANFTLKSGNSVTFVTDGTNWFSSKGASASTAVTSVGTGAGLTGGPITTTGTISASNLVKSQTGSTYNVLNSDQAKLLSFNNSGGILVSLPQAGAGSQFVAGWMFWVQNTGSGLVTISPSASSIDGAANVTIGQNQGMAIFSDGGNYFTSRGAGGSNPSGTILDYAGTSVPTGYLNCDGSAISRATFASLFAAIGTNWGSGDGSTTFNIPNLSRLVTVGSGGAASGILGNTVGSSGGSETHTLTQAELPNYNLPVSVSDPGHAHTVPDIPSFPGNGAYPSGSLVEAVTNPSTTNNVTGITVTVSSGGSNTPHNIIQPSAIVLKIIKI